jgi:signal peptidase
MVPVMTRGDFVVVENRMFEFETGDIEIGDIIVYSAHWTNANENNVINQGLTINGRELDYYEESKKSGIIYTLPVISRYSKTTPVIHRVIDIWDDNQGNRYFITKGDNNPTYDPELIRESQVRQRVIIINENPFVIPYLGHISLILKENVYWFLIIFLVWSYYDYQKEKKKKKGKEELN